MGDIVLLMRAVEQVWHGAGGVDRDVFSAVYGLVDGHRRGVGIVDPA